MEDVFSIYIDRLRGGKEELLNEVLPSDFVDVDEPDLAFPSEVKISGKAYIAEKDLLIFLKVETEARVPCSICNEPVSIPVSEEIVHDVPLEEIPSGIYSFREYLRETILLSVPPFVECSGGKCPKREEVKQYLKDPVESEEGETYQPFADWPFDEGEK